MIKLHIGCGSRDFGRDWLHIDGNRTYPHVDLHNIHDIELPDDSVELIYASHLLEYFDRKEVLPLLAEWNRVLKKGGVLRLSVPDIQRLIEIYRENDLDAILGPLYGKMKIDSNDSKYVYHKTIYDEPSLQKVLEVSGFKDVRRWNWKETEHHYIDDHSQAYFPHMDKTYGVLISLNLEATKR